MTKIRRGAFKGRKVTYAATERVEDFRQLASEFMAEVFDFLPGDYLITDESSLRDSGKQTFHPSCWWTSLLRFRVGGTSSSGRTIRGDGYNAP